MPIRVLSHFIFNPTDAQDVYPELAFGLGDESFDAAVVVDEADRLAGAEAALGAGSAFGAQVGAKVTTVVASPRALGTGVASGPSVSRVVTVRPPLLVGVGAVGPSQAQVSSQVGVQPGRAAGSGVVLPPNIAQSGNAVPNTALGFGAMSGTSVSANSKVLLAASPTGSGLAFGATVADFNFVPASNIVGSGAAFLVALGAVPPGIPVLSGVAGDNKCTLSWTTPANGSDIISGYRLIRNLLQPDGVIFDLGNLNTYVDPTAGQTAIGPQNGTSYTYHVQAYNGQHGDASNQVTLLPAASSTAPGAPVLSGSAGVGVVHLSWSLPSSGGQTITGYRVINGGFLIATPTASPRTYDDVSGNDPNAYQVAAVNIVGQGPYSNVVTTSPLVATGAPTLPGNQAVGRPANEVVFLTSQSGWQSSTLADYQRWRSNLNFGHISVPANNGYLYGYTTVNSIGDNLGQRLQGSTAIGSGDGSLSYQKTMEGSTGPYHAAKSISGMRVFQKTRLKKFAASTDLGPFGMDWWDDAAWNVLATRFGNYADGIQFLGGAGMHFDDEGGHWDKSIAGTGHTIAEQMVKIEARGYQVGSAIYQNFPNFIGSIYNPFFKGMWKDEVVAHNAGVKAGSSTWGVYNGHSQADLANLTQNNASVFDGELMGNYRVSQFYEGIWRAGSVYGGAGAKWWFQDAFFYHGSTQYPNISYQLAMRWNLWGTFSWLTRTLPQATVKWLLPRFYVSPTIWATADNTDNYFGSQLGEPAYSNLASAGRTWGMGGMRSEYNIGQTTGTPDEFVDGVPDQVDSVSKYIRGRPRGGITWGRNAWTGAADPFATAHTGTLGTNVWPSSDATRPTNPTPAGSTVSYGAASPTATPSWSPAFNPATTSRVANMQAAASVTTLGTPLPTISNLAAAAAGGNITVTCQARHSHSPWYLKVYRGSTFNASNPEASVLGVMTMVFQPNNGTNLPPAGLTDPYMACTFTTTGNTGDWFVVKCVSTKEDVAWARVQA